MQRFRKENAFSRDLVMKEMKKMRNSNKQYGQRLKWSFKKKV